MLSAGKPARGGSPNSVMSMMRDPSRAHADAASLFTASLAEADPEIADVMQARARPPAR